MKTKIGLLCLILFLTSCSSAIQTSLTAVNTISALPPSSVPTSTNTPTTISATRTATLSFASAPNQNPASTPLNFSSFLTASAIRGSCWGAQDIHYEDVSPRGSWFAVTCKPNDTSEFYGTKLVKLNSDVVWNVSFYETYGKKYDIQHGEIHVVHWSNDGNYAYLVPSFCCADAPGNIFFNYFQDTLALYRLDLRTGKLTTTLQPYGNVFSGYSASLSPFSKYLAYVISNSTRDIHINDLQTGDAYTLTIDAQYIASGNFEWSPDGNKAIFMGVKFGWDSETPISNGFSYFLLDLKTKTSNHIFDQPDMYPVSWTQDRNIILHNVSGKDGLLYNLQNNTFTAVTPTPSP